MRPTPELQTTFFCFLFFLREDVSEKPDGKDIIYFPRLFREHLDTMLNWTEQRLSNPTRSSIHCGLFSSEQCGCFA